MKYFWTIIIILSVLLSGIVHASSLTIEDLVERNDIKYFNFTPAGELGTDNLDKYMRKLTPGEFIRKINKKDKDA